MKTNTCPFCDFGNTYEYKSTEHFQYGCDEEAVMLFCNIIVLACSRCSQKWTDYRSEDTRQAAIEKHLANKRSKTVKTFILEGKELDNYEMWMSFHNKTCPFKNGKDQGAIGGRITFKFTPTGIGKAVSAECACGAEKNLTDYSNW